MLSEYKESGSSEFYRVAEGYYSIHAPGACAYSHSSHPSAPQGPCQIDENSSARYTSVVEEYIEI